MITDEQIRRVQAQNAERDAARARQKKLVDPTRSPSAPLGNSLATLVDEATPMQPPIGKTLMEIFSEEEDDPTDPGISLMEILSKEDDHG